MKFLLLTALLFGSCATTSEYEWKQKRMMKADKKMIKKVWRTRKFAK